ncbi:MULTISPECIES: AI-2E family transporter [Paraburkholderia]|uniref:AI-2E family transporter n=1 Tax=Paraburkholderia TaxID=1822464 RepID=UPI00225494FD|nr:MULTISPECIES: AI-2E family transporter [Paraburkholderia]MCX4160226.1 AI-2E family transporter [Paraburkholderia megapolitana]MDN7155725.1 AI-2E family transporter [Paraburkholderia sp. CHISQ3]MDQ6492769.1 AI-2E family transporter [Paraburkholderia megapolitana]
MSQPRPPNRVFPTGAPGIQTLTTVIISVVVVCGLYFGRAVLVPITLAVLLSFLLAPLVGVLRRLRIGQVPSIVVAVVIALVTLLAVSTLIAAQFAQLATDLPQYQVAIEAKIETVQEKTIGRADALLSRASTALQGVMPKARPQHGGRAQRPTAAAPMPVEVHEPMPSPLELTRRVFSPVVGPLETMFIVIVVTIFILFQREDLRDRLIRLFGSSDLHRTTTALNDAAKRLSRYFVAQLGVNLGTGAVISTGLAIIGVPGALLFGVLTALLRFVPYIGTWIAAILATVLAAAIQPQWTMGVLTLVLFVVVDIVAGQIVEPLLYGHSSGLSPLAVVVAAIFWSWLWGPIGLVLSTPLTLCLVTLGRYADRLKFIAVLLGDQPALTPAQMFYQRLLADDPQEAIDQAMRLLRDLPLIDYYDNVAREGLRLARTDTLRGVFSPEQLVRMNESLLDIVESLEDIGGAPDERLKLEIAGAVESAGPAADDNADGAREREHDLAALIAPARGANVLCIAGRGAFDDAAVAIAVQLLTRFGLAPAAATYEQFRKRHTDPDATGDATIVCVLTLDAAEAPLYLQNLLRRVQERAPAATLIVGVGGPGESVAGASADSDARSAATFRDLVGLCLLAGGVAARP